MHWSARILNFFLSPSENISLYWTAHLFIPFMCTLPTTEPNTPSFYRLDTSPFTRRCISLHVVVHLSLHWAVYMSLLLHLAVHLSLHWAVHLLHHCVGRTLLLSVFDRLCAQHLVDPIDMTESKTKVTLPKFSSLQRKVLHSYV